MSCKLQRLYKAHENNRQTTYPCASLAMNLSIFIQISFNETHEIVHLLFRIVIGIFRINVARNQCGTFHNSLCGRMFFGQQIHAIAPIF